MSPQNIRLRLLIAVSAVIACVGCSALPTSSSTPEVDVSSSSVGQPPVCTIENLVGSSPKRTEVPVTDEMRVQTALETMGKLPRGNLDVYIIRPTPGRPGPGLKLGCLYNARVKRVSMETDYAVLPGDRIVLRQSSEGPTGDLFGALLSPLTGG